MFPISDPGLPTRRFPIVNVTLIAISVVVFLYEVFILNDFELTRFFNNYGVVPYEISGKGDISELIQAGDDSVLGIEGVRGMLIQSRQIDLISGVTLRDPYEGGPPTVWLTPFTSMFLHGGWMHLIGNMVFLWVFGDNVEDRLGRIKYLVFYAICGLFAAVTQLMSSMIRVDLESGIPMVGASGAIAGVLGAYFILHPTSQIRTIVFFFLITLIHLPAYLLIGIWIFMQFFSAVVGSLGSDFAGGVAYWAHVGGFVAGLLIIAAFLGVSGVRQRFIRRS
ncbi:MAG: rhomboid family intramembrane serine protease [Dehalococcoidia bacterium]